MTPQQRKLLEEAIRTLQPMRKKGYWQPLKDLLPFPIKDERVQKKHENT